MKYRTLGHGLEVSAIGIGCMPMIRDGNINYGLADDDVSTRTIQEAIDLGITLFDTAEMYGRSATRNWSVRRSRAGATGSSSQPNSRCAGRGTSP